MITRISGIIVLFLASAILVGIAIGNYSAARRTDSIVGRIHALGGSVYLEMDEATRVRPLYQRPEFWDSVLGQVADVDEIIVEDAQRTPLRDLFCLQAFPHVRQIKICNAEATAEVVDEITRAPRLVWLELESCRIENGWLKDFKNAAGLRGIVLNGNPVGNPTIDCFKGCSAIRYIGIRGTRITEPRIKEYWERTAPVDCTIFYQNAAGQCVLLEPQVRAPICDLR